MKFIWKNKKVFPFSILFIFLNVKPYNFPVTCNTPTFYAFFHPFLLAVCCSGEMWCRWQICAFCRNYILIYEMFFLLFLAFSVLMLLLIFPDPTKFCFPSAKTQGREKKSKTKWKDSKASSMGKIKLQNNIHK